MRCTAVFLKDYLFCEHGMNNQNRLAPEKPSKGETKKKERRLQQQIDQTKRASSVIITVQECQPEH